MKHSEQIASRWLCTTEQHIYHWGLIRLTKRMIKGGNSHDLCSLLLLLSMEKASPSVIARVTTSQGVREQGGRVRRPGFSNFLQPYFWQFLYRSFRISKHTFLFLTFSVLCIRYILWSLLWWGGSLFLRGGCCVALSEVAGVSRRRKWRERKKDAKHRS